MCAAPVRAGLVATALADNLEQRAAAVVVGTMTTSIQEGDKTTFQLKIDRVLKGNLVPKTTITVSTTIPLPNGKAMVPVVTYERVWFLQGGAAGAFELLPTRGGDIMHLVYAGLPAEPEPPTGVYARLPSDSPLDLIVKEACAYAEKEHDWDGDEAAIQSLGETNTPTMYAVLRRFAQSGQPVLRAMGLAGLIQRGDVESLLQLEADLKGRLSGIEDTFCVSDLMAAIEFRYRQPDPRGIAALGRLATSSTLLRRPSVDALRGIHTKDTLPWLLKILDSPKADEAYDAMWGIAGFATGMPVATIAGAVNFRNLAMDPKAPFYSSDMMKHLPNLEDFEQNRAQYAGFWKNWYAAHQAAIEGMH
jgi:hypothetical protein